MITYFPEIYPDELVYSWFCRYCVHSGSYSSKMALTELYCKKSDNPSKEFIGNLNDDARSLIDKIYPIDELVLEHTMYSQYARFIPLEQKIKAMHQLRFGSCDVHHLFSSLPRNEGEKYLRFCPLCAKEDREKYGEAYWHRKHQIKNMSICTKHKCRLEESSVPAKSEQSFIFYPAENHITEKSVIYVYDSLVIKFAEYMEKIFDMPIDFENDIPLSAILYHGMSRTKYLKSTGKCRYTKMLADDLNEYYSKIGLCSVASMYQVQRVLLGNRFDFSVVCQIAFFLGIEIEELTKPTLTDKQVEQEQNSHYMKNTIPVNWSELDKETAPILEQIASDIYNGIAGSRPERVSEKLIYRELGLAKHRLDNMPMCKKVLKKYEESYPESWARKIVWAYEKSTKEKDGNVYWSDIRKISGVKKHNFQSVIPFLSKYTDETTIKAILALIE